MFKLDILGSIQHSFVQFIEQKFKDYHYEIFLKRSNCIYVTERPSQFIQMFLLGNFCQNDVNEHNHLLHHLQNHHLLG